MTNSRYRCLKLPTESYERRLLLVEKLKEFNGLILFGSLFVFVHTLESSKTMNLTITNNAPKYALFHGGHDRPCSLLQLMRGRPSMSRDRKQ